VNGKERMLHKNPITDSGEKKSARGRIVIRQADGGLQMTDSLTVAQQNEYDNENLLKLVWKDGKFVRRNTLAQIRARVR
jgi:nicotinamide phosphoribosyltransferase